MVVGYYPDSQRIVREVGKLLGLGDEKLEGALRSLEAQRKDLPIDVPDPFFKGPF